MKGSEIPFQLLQSKEIKLCGICTILEAGGLHSDCALVEMSLPESVWHNELAMNILFIDDTEQNKGKYVGIGGVIFCDEYIDDLFSKFRSTKEIHGIPSEEEIKWSPRKDSWIFENLVEDKRISA